MDPRDDHDSNAERAEIPRDADETAAIATLRTLSDRGVLALPDADDDSPVPLL